MSHHFRRSACGGEISACRIEYAHFNRGMGGCNHSAMGVRPAEPWLPSARGRTDCRRPSGVLFRTAKSRAGRERFCNLAAWCVIDEYRSLGLRLLNALLAQKGYHFTDLSPSGNVVPLNTRLKFSHLDVATALVPNLPWPLWPAQSPRHLRTKGNRTHPARPRPGDLPRPRAHRRSAPRCSR